MNKTLNQILKYAPIIAIVILILLCLKQCSNMNDLSRKNAQLQQSEQIAWGNIQVLKDTVKYWKDADGNSKSQISILSGNAKMLESNFKDLTSKYNAVVGNLQKDHEMIAYLNTQISIKDREISDLKKADPKDPNPTGNRIINDSTIVLDIVKNYDSSNYYKVNGTILTSIKDNKIAAGKIDVTTEVGIGLELAISRDKKTKIAKLTSKTAFPAKVNLSGLTKIETELNKKPASYIGLSIFCGYGAALQQTPFMTPFIGAGVYYSPRWLTIKLKNR